MNVIAAYGGEAMTSAKKIVLRGLSPKEIAEYIDHLADKNLGGKWKITLEVENV